MPRRQREEVLNVVLAECISELGMEAAPESIRAEASGRRAFPDVIVSFRGLRCCIEGKYSDVQDARKQVISDASERVESGIAHMAIGVLYPATLRQVAFSALKDEMRKASFEFLVCTETGNGHWHKGDLQGILAELRRAHDVLTHDDVVVRAVERLRLGMSGLVLALTSSPAACARLSDTLGVYAAQSSSEDEGDSRE